MSEEKKIRKRIEYINKRIKRLIEKIENLKPSDNYSIKKFTKEKI
jgi:transposase-like protein